MDSTKLLETLESLKVLLVVVGVLLLKAMAQTVCTTFGSTLTDHIVIFFCHVMLIMLDLQNVFFQMYYF